MSKLTDSLAAKLDDCIIENFADIYEMEGELGRIAKKHDLASSEVIAAIATVADVGAAQARLVAQPPKALVKGLEAALARPLRPPAKLLVEALLDGAKREAGATASKPPIEKKNKLPPFARPARLPPLMTTKGKAATQAEVEAFLHVLMTKKLGDAPDSGFSAESLSRWGRALALGWLSHGAEPQHAWGAWAAGHFPDEATAKDLGFMARELGPRVGQFSKAQILVDVLAAMNTRPALDALHELSTKVKTKSVRDRARLAFDAAAKRAGVSKDDLADKLLRDDAPVGKDFVKRLEQRMVTGAKMPAVELVENILQRDAVRARARGVVFGAAARKKLATFTIDEEGGLVDVNGKPYTLPSNANVVVVHPLDLAERELAKWRAKIAKAPFPQLDRPLRRLASTRALAKHAKKITHAKQGAIYGLESLGWRRGEVVGGRLYGMKRELDGVNVSLDFEPGIYLGRGMGTTDQRITKISIDGEGSSRALAEIARELDTLSR